ncbi:hypothetical protein CRG98_019610 [Punica granatum]|uniref:Uncharacterized protein n=1 Tax=Punica granatum TaxID=22663 RepID=A0A2I0JUT9_PUNGR|nr:hypothetical protein CRG98_019610 [Punica granatum]
MEASSSLASCSSRFLLKEKTPKCSYRAIETLCTTCLCCVSCPLAIVCGFIKAPCKIGKCAAKKVRARACCGSKRIYAGYSSFSDIDSDSLSARLHSRSKNSCHPKSKQEHSRARDSGTRKDRCYF